MTRGRLPGTGSAAAARAAGGRPSPRPSSALSSGPIVQLERWPTARRAPGRSGVPSMRLRRVRCAAWRGRTAAGAGSEERRGGETCALPISHRSIRTLAYRAEGTGAQRSAEHAAEESAVRRVEGADGRGGEAGLDGGTAAAGPPGLGRDPQVARVAALELGDDLRPGPEPAGEDLHGRGAELA